MPHIDIINAGKDKQYYRSLSKEQRTQLPQNRTGRIKELTDAQMEAVTGGYAPFQISITDQDPGTIAHIDKSIFTGDWYFGQSVID
ncbi:MAG: mersacidin/lichenicidin family type 2 lantibiotic [Coleofasciculus sp. G1-WW12-02]|uniref:mersacidin/lichenicidin family type 2 lantibiotic n=1 Tax=Coleofasciculus sp. G1-WW12-02 TaxID=3068483 RepID=UPI003302B849